ncbi:uncharacterized protein LOC116181788 [Photinus pyralis]|uniref:uncharacterized protein LOC116181788 n=1 Tax=Photinus pyralis TaxID=7054 RepID=UPI001266E9AA|nr:uncharacterized protein LOC116181788 [Photinus pyralis]
MYTQWAGQPKTLRTPPLREAPTGSNDNEEVIPETPMEGRRKREDTESSTDSDTDGSERNQTKRPRRASGYDTETVIVSPKSTMSDLGDIRKLQTEGAILAASVQKTINEAVEFGKKSTNTNNILKGLINDIKKEFTRLENHRLMAENKWAKYVAGLKVASLRGDEIHGSGGRKTSTATGMSPKETRDAGTSPVKGESARRREATYATALTGGTALREPVVMLERTSTVLQPSGGVVERVNEERKKRVRLVDVGTTSERETGTDTEGEWKTQGKRRPRRKAESGSGSEGTTGTGARRRNRRAEAVLVKLKGENHMEDILKRIRQTDMSGVSTKIESISRTRNGDILLRVEKGAGKAEPVLSKIKAAISDREVTLLEDNCTLVVRDLDAVTTENEVLGAIIQTVSGARCRIKSMITVERGQKVAYVHANREAAEEILARGYLLVGLTSCRVRISQDLVRCNRCWEIGHIADACRGEDRRAQCYNCGNAGHYARECSNEATCKRCEGLAKGLGVGHRAYTRQCMYETRKSEMGETMATGSQGGDTSARQGVAIGQEVENQDRDIEEQVDHA